MLGKRSSKMLLHNIRVLLFDLDTSNHNTLVLKYYTSTVRKLHSSG